MPYKLLVTFLLIAATSDYLCAQGYPGARAVSCRQDNMTLEHFFRVIYEQTGMTAFYNDEQLNSYERVSVNYRNEPLDNILARLLRKRGMAWCYRRDVFVIAFKRPGDVDLGYLPGEDKRTITGMVVNEKNAPLEAVTVMTGDKLNGMPTGDDGKFMLRDVEPGAKLLVQRSGYKPMVLSSYADSIYIQMIPMVAPLQEVSVTGAAVATLTGSVSQVKAKEIAESPVNNVLGALQGRIPGLYINQTTGLPGGGYRIRLRGKNSIESNSDPLILVDGVPFPSVSFNENFFNMAGTTGANVAPSPLNLLSVNDIESVQILKDADATAIYGTRGANGVILINSKSPGENGKGLTANVYSGIGKATNLVHYLDTKQYLEMRREAFKNDETEPEPTVDHDLLNWDQNRYTDWQKEMIGGTANILDASLEMKGGNKIWGYRVSGLYRQESTVYPSENFRYKKGGTMLQLRYNSKNQKLRTELSGNYVADRNYLPTVDLTILSTTPPNTPEIYSRDRKLNFADSTFDNPYAILLQTTKATSNTFRTHLNTSWEPVKDLVFNADVGGSTFKTDEVQIIPARSFTPSMGYSSYGHSFFYINRYQNGLMDLRGSWKKTIGQEQFSLVAGARFQFEGQFKTGYSARGYTGDDASMEDTTAAEDVSPSDTIKSNFQNQSFYGRLEYKHADKYVLTLTLNRDGSSRLVRSYSTFGTIGAAWIFSRESWFRKNGLLNFGKLRGSYGITGNDQYSRNLTRGTYVWGLPFYKNGIQQAKFDYNPSHGWEKIRKAEVALDLGLSNDRILATFCYYNNRSTDQLLTGRFQTIAADPSKDVYMPVNVPAVVENIGLEIDLEGVVFQNSRVTWSTNLNLSFPKNRLVSFPHLERSLYRIFYREGMALDGLIGFQLKGVDAKTGVYQFEDIENNGIALQDRVFSKEWGPFFYGGWYNHIRFKNFEVSCLLKYTRQNNYNYQYTPALNPPGGIGNQPLTVLDRWQKNGDKASIQQYTTSVFTPAGTAFQLAKESDQRLTDANYLRLQSFVLAYNLPQKKLMRAKGKSCKLYLEGLNLFTLTRYNGRDPEVTATPDSYPSLRVVTAGVQLSF